MQRSRNWAARKRKGSRNVALLGRCFRASRVCRTALTKALQTWLLLTLVQALVLSSVNAVIMDGKGDLIKLLASASSIDEMCTKLGLTREDAEEMRKGLFHCGLTEDDVRRFHEKVDITVCDYLKAGSADLLDVNITVNILKARLPPPAEIFVDGGLANKEVALKKLNDAAQLLNALFPSEKGANVRLQLIRYSLAALWVCMPTCSSVPLSLRFLQIAIGSAKFRAIVANDYFGSSAFAKSVNSEAGALAKDFASIRSVLEYSSETVAQPFVLKNALRKNKYGNGNVTFVHYDRKQNGTKVCCAVAKAILHEFDTVERPDCSNSSHPIELVRRAGSIIAVFVANVASIIDIYG